MDPDQQGDTLPSKKNKRKVQIISHPIGILYFIPEPCHGLSLPLEDSKLLKKDKGGPVRNISTLILLLSAEERVEGIAIDISQC